MRGAPALEGEIRTLFDDEGIVLLDFTTSSHGGRMTLRAVGDRKDGLLSIDDCVRLTRQIQHLISEKCLLADDYRLEVSSPGLDYPLREMWQFVKNVGRMLKVNVHGERGPREISGRLTAADAEGITLRSDEQEWTPRYGELLNARVLPEINPPRKESKR